MRVLPLPAALRSGGSGLDFPRVLMEVPHGRLSGTLLVTGDPGGRFHLEDGVILEVTSPGSPGVETLLLRSGRVTETDWASAVRSGAAGRRVGAELVARELVGSAELQLICVMAALDGALAMGMGRIDRVTLDPEPPSSFFAAPEGIEPEWLSHETERRIRALGGQPVTPFRDRLSRTDAGTRLLDDGIAGERRDILRTANGRRSCRDIAFLLGRGLYAVTVETSRLLHEGLVGLAPSALEEAEGSFPAPEGDRNPEPAGQSGRSGNPARLPRRRPGASGITDVLPLRPVSGPWRPSTALAAEDRRFGSAQ
ncbi:MarR family transcriptional regulator [Kitasatospora sp. NPDC004669]|uniref:MarR family transcriptional regulator n=1 Tax=Kitasatospora sp. NPDC004669 TaxID=3154555 RepID=UPI0033A9AD29